MSTWRPVDTQSPPPAPTSFPPSPSALHFPSRPTNFGSSHLQPLHMLFLEASSRKPSLNPQSASGTSLDPASHLCVLDVCLSELFWKCRGQGLSGSG